MGIENLYLRCDPLPDGEAVDLEHSSLKGAVVPSLGSASVEISGFVSEICTHVGDTVLGRDSICLCLTQANVGVTYDAAESSAIRITGGTALVSWPGSAQAAGPVLLFVTDDDVTGKATALLPCKAETHSGKSWRLPSRLTGQTVVDFARLVAVAVQSSESASYCVHVLHRTFLWATPSIKFFLIAVWVSFVLYLLTSLPGLRGRGLYYAWVIGICCSVVFAAGMLLVITRGRFFAWLADSGVRTAVFLCGLAGVGLQVVGAAVGLRFGFPPANPQQTPDELWWVALPRLGVGTGSTLLFGVLPWNKSGWLPVVVVLAFVALITALSRPASTRSWLSELLLRLGVTLAFTLVVGPLFYALFVGPVPTAQLADYFAATWLRELGTGAVFAGAVASLAQAFRRR